MVETARLYFRLVGARIRAQLQYRTSFAIEVAGQFLISFLDFAMIAVIFTNVPALGGWSVAEVALLYGISGIAFAVADMLIGHLDDLPDFIRTGNFDVLLIRPRGTLLQVATSDFQLRRLGRIAQGAVVLGYALVALDVEWTAGRVAVLALAIVSAVVIFCAIWVAVIGVVFWLVEGREVANAFTYGGQFATQYPINIYEEWLRRFLGYLVPIAFVSYFPALYVLDKPDPLGLPQALQLMSPVVALAACGVSALAWRGAVRHYQSAGG